MTGQDLALKVETRVNNKKKMRERISVLAAILFFVCFCDLATSYCVESSLQTEITGRYDYLKKTNTKTTELQLKLTFYILSNCTTFRSVP